MDMDANSLITIGARFATIEANLQNAIVGFDARLKRLEERYKQEETNRTQAERKKMRELQAELK
jgi:hypothetical protein